VKMLCPWAHCCWPTLIPDPRWTVNAKSPNSKDTKWKERQGTRPGFVIHQARERPRLVEILAPLRWFDFLLQGFPRGQTKFP
jgi:hypothetical protein